MKFTPLLTLALCGAQLTAGQLFNSLDACAELNVCEDTHVTIDSVNHRVRPVLQKLVQTDFFRYFKLNLFDKECPFWEDDGMCASRSCAVDTIEDLDALPEIWRPEHLSQLRKDSIAAAQAGPDDEKLVYAGSDIDTLAQAVDKGCLSNENAANLHILSKEEEDASKFDYCVLDADDEAFALNTDKNLVYVDLVANPERFTGYGGKQAGKVWSAIYQENCFREHWNNGPVDAASTFTDSSAMLQASAPSQDARESIAQESCLEKRVFYRLVSGMHASIAVHLCNDYLNTTTGVWGPNLDCFMSKVGRYPDRVSNIYFNYAVLSRAITKLASYLDAITFCCNNDPYDEETRNQFARLAAEMRLPGGGAAKNGVETPQLFNESLLFALPDSQSLKEDFRQRFRNVSAIMDCVGCDRCRLWGKVQTMGYGTALKVLFELPSEEEAASGTVPDIVKNLRRIEIVSLVNTFDRLSKSVQAMENFKNMQRQQELRARRTSSWGQAWDEEWAHFIEAITFILRSYIDLPRNLWHIFLYYSIKLWNMLIGRDMVNLPSYDASFYKLDL